MAHSLDVNRTLQQQQISSK